MVQEDAADLRGSHDFSKDVLPAASIPIAFSPTTSIPIGSPARLGTVAYWRDVGTVDAYFRQTWALVQPPR